MAYHVINHHRVNPFLDTFIYIFTRRKVWNWPIGLMILLYSIDYLIVSSNFSLKTWAKLNHSSICCNSYIYFHLILNWFWIKHYLPVVFVFKITHFYAHIYLSWKTKNNLYSLHTLNVLFIVHSHIIYKYHSKVLKILNKKIMFNNQYKVMIFGYKYTPVIIF